MFSVIRTVRSAPLRAGTRPFDQCRSFRDRSTAARPPEDRSSDYPPYRHDGRDNVPRSARLTSAESETGREGWPDCEVCCEKFARISPPHRRGRVAGRTCTHNTRGRARGGTAPHAGGAWNDGRLRDCIRVYTEGGKGYGPLRRRAGHHESKYRWRSTMRASPHQ